MRKRLYTVVEQGRNNDWVSYIYDFIILAAITAALKSYALKRKIKTDLIPITII